MVCRYLTIKFELQLSIWLLVLLVCSMNATANEHSLLRDTYTDRGVSTARSLSHAYNVVPAYLSSVQKLDYFVGQSFFRNPWVSAPASTGARDGLGPLFNGNSCMTCHLKNGRGSVDDKGMVVRLARHYSGHYIDDSYYGGQLQSRAVVGVAPEAHWHIQWQQYNVMLADGTVVNLRAPNVVIDRWSYGKPDTGTRWSARIAPALIGLGLIEAIAQQQIIDYASQQADDFGISGRPSWVIDRSSGRKLLGRFGWKALHPTVKQQSAKAFSEDLGLRSSLYPEPVCTKHQPHCLQQMSGGTPEVSDSIMDAVSYYTRNGVVPSFTGDHNESYQRGRAYFHQAGCAHCHRPHWRTEQKPGLPAQDIWPYTDLLLHDMGAALAAPAGEAGVSGREWRTPPLWGIGLAKTVNRDTGFLHDGRARNLLEAILWHGGEARGSRQAVRLMSATERSDLLYFLNNL